MNLELFTDGSATTSDKPGGWAYIIVKDSEKLAECVGSLQNATNNDAELEAVIQGLSAILRMIMENPSAFPVNLSVTLVSDSQLILGWVNGSFRFKQAEKLSKYEELKKLVKKLQVKTRWVRGHSGDEYNERCDRLANEARLSIVRKADRENKILSGDTLIGTKKSGTFCVWYKGALKVIDLESDIVETYDRQVHGPRGSILEIREEKNR